MDEAPRRVALCRLGELPVGHVRIVLHRGPPPYRSILVVATALGLRAYWNVCQHLPIPLDMGAGVLPPGPDPLVCGTHGAHYRPEDGVCFEGPCEGSSLRAVPLEVEAGEVFALVAADGTPL